MRSATRAGSRSSSPDIEACLESCDRRDRKDDTSMKVAWPSIGLEKPLRPWLEEKILVNEEATPSSKNSIICSYPGLVADVWEVAEGTWHVTHHLVAGLELDCAAVASDVDGRHSRVHLPSISLRALQLIRVLLQKPHAVELDVDYDRTSPRYAAKSPCHCILQVLLDQMGISINEACKTEAWRYLETRNGESPMDDVLTQISQPPSPRLPFEDQGAKTDWEQQSLGSENLLRPLDGMESVDISICPLPQAMAGMPTDEPVSVAICRLSAPAAFAFTSKVPVRYAALVICGAEAESLQLAREVARAIATTFMDEEFAGKVRVAPRNQPEHVLHAFESFLSTLTIVPTVYVGRNSRPGGGDMPGLIANQLLSDSLVESLEKLICRVRGLPKRNEEVKLHHHALPNQHLKSQTPSLPHNMRSRYFVEVNEQVGDHKWGVMHRLQQGLQVDINTHSAHLPRISVAALAQARQIMHPASVALDVLAVNVQAAIDAIIGQVRRAGIAEGAVAEISRTLVDRIALGADVGRIPRHADIGTKEIQARQEQELLRPDVGDEACHVWVTTCRQLVDRFVGAFVRFRSPLGFQFDSNDAPVRFLMVIVGPPQAHEDIRALGDSLAGLLLDEDLMGDLASVSSAQLFVDAVDKRLDELVVVPHARVHACGKGPVEAWNNDQNVPSPIAPSDIHGNAKKVFGTKGVAGTVVIQTDDAQGSLAENFSVVLRRRLQWLVSKAQKYSLPLIFGVLVALVWAGVDEDGYHDMAEKPLWEGASVLGHDFSLHFFVNDIFMCFFFGLAIKEVTEALLPGGSLSPISRAVNPLMATCGGVVGPIVAYIVCVAVLQAAGTFDGEMCVKEVSERRLGGSVGVTGEQEPCKTSMLMKGWGVPTATDISLAWMFALFIFGAGHPAINFLLLLAIVDDALGMVIIAVFYPDPAHPVEPLWLLLVLAATMLAGIMRWLQVPFWQPYIFLCGPIAWFGLIEAHVHPALALVFIVPLLPAQHASKRHSESAPHIGACDLGPAVSPQAQQAVKVAEIIRPGMHPRIRRQIAMTSARLMSMYFAEDAPLHVFEHTLKLPVDLGMFFFGLANAGVKMNQFGGITISVVVALVIGKTLGIAGFALLAVRLGFGLPCGVTYADLFAMSALGGVGLTVALFVANQAFVDPGLQGQAKMGAVISVASAGVAFLIRYVFGSVEILEEEEDIEDCEAEKVEHMVAIAPQLGSVPATDWIDDILTDEIFHIMWTKRKYEARGVKISTDQMRAPSPRRASKKSSIMSGPAELRRISSSSQMEVCRTCSHQQAEVPGAWTSSRISSKGSTKSAPANQMFFQRVANGISPRSRPQSKMETSIIDPCISIACTSPMAATPFHDT